MNRGFSVIEALAAIALLSIAMLPLFELQRTLSQSAIRLEQATADLDAQQSALSLISALNPMEMPEGEENLGAWTVSWTSELITGEAPADGYAGSSNFAVNLYDVTVQVRRADRTREFTVRKLGWRYLGEVGGVPIP